MSQESKRDYELERADWEGMGRPYVWPQLKQEFAQPPRIEDYELRQADDDGMRIPVDN